MSYLKENWNKIKHLANNRNIISVTPNSFDRETYRYLAGRDDLYKFEESMAYITKLKHEGAVGKIRIIMVIQDSNFRQIPQFIQKCIEYDADDIVLRPIFKWFGTQEDKLLFKNMLNPCHPYNNEYLDVIKEPICQDSRVFNWEFDVKQEAIQFTTLEIKRKYEELMNIKYEEGYVITELKEQINYLFSEKCEMQKKLEVQVKENEELQRRSLV